MKKLEAYCPVNGTAALRPNFDAAATARRENIIAFPGNMPAEDTVAPLGDPAAPSGAMDLKSYRKALENTEFMRSLRYGSAQGVAFNRVKRWQAVVIGLLIFTFSFATLLFEL